MSAPASGTGTPGQAAYEAFLPNGPIDWEYADADVRAMWEAAAQAAVTAAESYSAIYLNEIDRLATALRTIRDAHAPGEPGFDVARRTLDDAARVIGTRPTPEWAITAAAAAQGAPDKLTAEVARAEFAEWIDGQSWPLISGAEVYTVEEMAEAYTAGMDAQAVLAAQVITAEAKANHDEVAMLRADIVDYEKLVAKWPKCPAGCNCRIGIDTDPDANECGCDGPCNGRDVGDDGSGPSGQLHESDWDDAVSEATQ